MAAYTALRYALRMMVLGWFVWAAAALVHAGEPDEEAVSVTVVAPTDAPSGAVTLVVADSTTPGDELGDLLAQVPGAEVRRLGGLGAWTGVSLRGSSFRQVQIDLDGVPLNPDGVDSVDLSELPLAALDTVRVFRGRVPATYGASPMGGLVDLRTAARSGPPQLSAMVGSWGSLRGSGAGTFTNTHHTVDGLVAGDVFSTRGDFPYFSDGGTSFNQDDDAFVVREHAARTQAALTARVRFGSARLRGTVLDAVVGRREDLPGPTGDPAIEASLDTVRNLGVLQAELKLGATRTTARLWHLARVETLDDRAAELGIGGAWERDITQLLGAHVDGGVSPLAWLGVGWSASARGEWFGRRALANGSTDAPRGRTVLGAAADLRFAPPHGVVAIVPGVDVRALLAAGEKAIAAVNPGLAVEVSPIDALQLRLSGGRAFRPPDLSELYGDRGVLNGNPDLRPESSWQGDLSVRWASPRAWPVDWSFDAGGYIGWTRDRITWVQNSQATVRPVNFGMARIGGVELGTSLGWRQIVDARVSAAWTDARDVDPDSSTLGSRVPLVPQVVVDTDLGLAWPDHLRLGWSFHLTDGTFADATNLYRQPARLLHGLSLGWTLIPPLTLGFEVRNLTDRRVEVVERDPIGEDAGQIPRAVTDFVGYPLPGRTLLFTLTWRPR